MYNKTRIVYIFMMYVCMYVCVCLYVLHTHTRTCKQYAHTYVRVYTLCRYSLDEGATWYHHQFHNSTTFRTYGMLTEPGESTLVFGIYGADTSRWPHDWIVIRIDFSNILC